MRESIILFVMLMVGAWAAGCTSEPAPVPGPAASGGVKINITSDGQSYPAYIAAPPVQKVSPGIVLIHSFNGLEPGYLTLVDRLASQGYVVIAPEWQTYTKSPDDGEVGAVIRSSIEYLASRPDVDMQRLGLTGFCAGGRYTMLYLPRIREFKSGVAWYGFPYSRGFANESRPSDSVGQLSSPLLIIHGTADVPSPVTDIYTYATALNASGKYFELKVYQGEPHGFMIRNGQLNDSSIAQDAFTEMVRFFDRTLMTPKTSPCCQ